MELKIPLGFGSKGGLFNTYELSRSCAEAEVVVVFQLLVAHLLIYCWNHFSYKSRIKNRKSFYVFHLIVFVERIGC